MDEMVNIRHKDGSMRPIADAQEVTWIDSAGESVTSPTLDYEKIYVHNASNYKNLLGVKSGQLYWFATMDTDYRATMRTGTLSSLMSVASASKVFFSQIGNLVCIADGERLKYMLFRKSEGKYYVINADYNGAEDDTSLVPDGQIDFRVIPHTKKSIYSDINTNFPFNPEVTIIPSESNPIELGNVDDYGSIAIADLTKGINTMTQRGLLTGWVMAMTGVELYDGSVILSSRPVLLPPIYVDNTRSIPTHLVNAMLPKRNEYKDTSGYYTYPLFDTHNLNFDSTGRIEQNLTYGVMGTATNPVGDKTYCAVSDAMKSTDSGYADAKKFIESKLAMARPMATDELPPLVVLYAQSRTKTIANNTIDIDGETYTSVYANKSEVGKTTNGEFVIPGEAETNNLMGCTVAMGGDLQIKVNTSIPDNYKDIVIGYKIYMTDQINPYNLNETPVIKRIYRPTDRSNDGLIGANCYAKLKTNAEIKKELSTALFYEVASIKPKKQDWTTIDLKSKLSTIVNQTPLEWNCDRYAYQAGYVYSYNGRIHLANYNKQQFNGYPCNYFKTNQSKKEQLVAYGKVFANIGGAISPVAYTQYVNAIKQLAIDKNAELYGSQSSAYDSTNDGTNVEVVIVAKIENDNGTTYVKRKYNGTYRKLDAILTYPSVNCKQLKFYTKLEGQTTYKVRTFNMTEHNAYGYSYHIADDLNPIDLLDTINTTTTIPDVVDNDDCHPNGLKVSQTNNPFYFPVESTYQVGNAKIIAMCANTMALGTGQWGDAPLYVFCTDGIYAMFVDSSGQLAYSNSRPISREICNNADSVTPIDDAIVFTTERGLILMAGAETNEISETAEGRVYDFTNNLSFEYLNGINVLLDNEHLTSLGAVVGDNVEMSEYLKNVRIGYNYAEKEIYVTNPSKDEDGDYIYNYSYVFTKGYWTKKDSICDYYIGDYPKVYSLNSKLYDITKENNLGNETCFITRPIKFSTLIEKQNYRVVLRGNFVMNNATNYTKTACLIVYGSNDCNKWSVIGVQKVPDVPTNDQLSAGLKKCYDKNNGRFRDLGCTIYSQHVKYIKVAFVGNLSNESIIEHLEVSMFASNDKIR